MTLSLWSSIIYLSLQKSKSPIENLTNGLGVPTPINHSLSDMEIVLELKRPQMSLLISPQEFPESRAGCRVEFAVSR